MAKQRALEAARKEADRKATVLFRQQCAAERREEKRQERERLAEERCGTRATLHAGRVRHSGLG